MSRRTPWETNIFLKGRVGLYTGTWVSWCWVSKRDHTGWSEISMPRYNALKIGHTSERKGWALYRRVSELLLKPTEEWRRISEISLPTCNALRLKTVSKKKKKKRKKRKKKWHLNVKSWQFLIQKFHVHYIHCIC